MAYKILPKVNGYEARPGLEGPFTFGNGRTLYYDRTEGKYWDPRTDFFVSHEEAEELQGLLFNKIRG